LFEGQDERRTVTKNKGKNLGVGGVAILGCSTEGEGRVAVCGGVKGGDCLCLVIPKRLGEKSESREGRSYTKRCSHRENSSLDVRIIATHIVASGRGGGGSREALSISVTP